MAIDAPVITLEIALTPYVLGESAAVWVTIPRPLAFATKRGRQDELGTVQAGTCAVLVDNSDGALSPGNTASPYAPNLKVGRRLRLTASYNGTPYRQFRGVIEGINPLDNTAVDSNMVITAVDHFKYLNQQLLTTSYSTQDAGARITAVLSAVGNAEQTPSIETASSNVNAATLAQVAALQHIQDVITVERGVFFIARTGVPTYHARGHRFTDTRSNTSQATFGQTTDLPYKTLEYLYDDQFTYTDVQVTPTATGEGVQIATDAVAANEYGKRSLTISSGLFVSGQALSLAQLLLTNYKTPRTRVPSITIDADAAPASLYPFLLGCEIGDLITVKRNDPGTLAINMQMWIESVSLSYTASGGSGMIAVLNLSDPAAYGASPFRLDFSQLDGSDPLNY